MGDGDLSDRLIFVPKRKWWRKRRVSRDPAFLFCGYPTAGTGLLIINRMVVEPANNTVALKNFYPRYNLLRQFFMVLRNSPFRKTAVFGFHIFPLWWHSFVISRSQYFWIITLMYWYCSHLLVIHRYILEWITLDLSPLAYSRTHARYANQSLVSNKLKWFRCLILLFFFLYKL